MEQNQIQNVPYIINNDPPYPFVLNYNPNYGGTKQNGHLLVCSCEECKLNHDRQLADYLTLKPDATPDHYKGKVQPIDLIEAQELSFSRASIIKYVCRAGRKENELQDLKKALWYLQREINNVTNI